MEICHKCKDKQSEYNCDICKGSYCKECDLFIHSFSSKKNHYRNKIFYNQPSNKAYDTSRKKYTTDENGVLTIEGPEDIVILTFEGSTKLAPATTNVTINEAELVPTTVSVNSINKYATSSGKYELVATLKDVSGNPIYNKTVCIIDTTHDGQAIVIGVTGFDGVVKGSISASIVANYPICAFFPGDEMYASAIDFANVNVKINPTTLTTPTKTYKVKATKKLSVTLKSSGKAVKGKKITVKVNGKTYTAKTNAKGVATVTVKIAKKGTFKYTAKFAGDKLYKAVSKTGTIKVKA
jgi:tryptophanase